MKVKLTCKDGIEQTHYINPKNYDPERMKIIGIGKMYSALAVTNPKSIAVITNTI